MTDEQYSDDYATCAGTHASLFIYLPNEFQVSGIDIGSGFTGYGEPVTQFGLQSEGEVDSRDIRRHIDWLLNAAEVERAGLRQLRDAGCELVAWVFWVSRYGHGGPTLRPDQLSKLGDLGFELRFDIYFDDTPAEWEEVEIDGEMRMVTRHV